MQRRRLLLAFTELVASDGAEAVSVERVCRRAGVSRRTFYELFEDREACLLAAVESTLERIAREVAPVFDGSGSWCERVRGALTLVLARLDCEPGAARVLVVETQRAGPAVAELRMRVLDALTLAVDQGRQAKGASRLPPLTAQGIVGAVLYLAQSQIAADPAAPLSPLALDLMASIVYPYLGRAAAARELSRPSRAPSAKPAHAMTDPFRGLPIRFTYRTALVLDSIAQRPGASNRQIADSSDITDQGQVSRLLSRLHGAGLIANEGRDGAKGEPNAWRLTGRGRAIHDAVMDR
jgi:AcrR family transcriptional regulator